MRLNDTVPEVLATQGATEVLSIFPLPVTAKFPVTELLFGGTTKLNTPMLPFSVNCKVKV